MKLNENNARFAVVRTALHGGGTISFHKSLKAALKVEKENTQSDCVCGCCAVVPITKEARKELVKNGYAESETALYEDVPSYTANGEHYSKICK